MVSSIAVNAEATGVPARRRRLPCGSMAMELADKRPWG